MKRKTVLLLSLILLLGFSGCGKAEEDGRGFDAARSFAHFYSSTWVRETTDTLYFLGWSDHYIKYADKATGISGVLCGRPECRHNDENCNAYVDAECILMDGDRLYWMAVEFTDSGIQYVLYSMALDGTDRRKETELPEGFIPSSTAAHRHYLLYDGWLYFGDVSSEIINGEQIHHNYVAAAPIGSTQEPFVILKEDPIDRGYSNLAIQFYKGDLYILTCEPSPLNEGEEYLLYDCTLRRWNAETDELETLYEDESVLNWSSELWVTDDGVLFNRNTSTTYGPLENRIYKYYFDSGECEYLFDNGIYGWANMGLIADDLVSGQQITDGNDGTYDFYVMLKDFEGNVLVDETYTLDIWGGYANDDIQDIFSIDFVGRDEEYAYYSFAAFDKDGTSYISLVSVALDGGGAQVMCTQAEACTEQWASGQIS